jgi:predicted transposase YbfD/YdcC
VKYPLINVITIALCAVLSGADDFVAITTWARFKIQWLSKFLDMSAGIPSHDRFNAIFAAIKPEEFEQCFLSWIGALQQVTGGQLVAIDTKTLRGSFDKASSKAAIQMVTAWACANRISLGQLKVNPESNEITAIPQLLDSLELAGCMVTIDAIGCQTEIAAKIVEAGADYVLAVKGNQPTLHQGIVDHFLQAMESDDQDANVSRHSTSEKGHGRIENRWYHVRPAPTGLPDAGRWKNIKAIGVAISETLRDGKICSEVRYYILSKALSASEFAKAVRGHWGIENHLHWQLDVSFGEDQCRLRKGHSDQNFSILRRLALTLLSQNKTLKIGVKNKRLTAGWDESYLLELLFGK